MKSSFILHCDSLCVLDKMTDEQAGRFIKALYLHQANNNLPELDPLLDMAITPFLNQFARDEKEYKKTCERNKKNAAKRKDELNQSHPLVPTGTHSVPVVADNDNDNDNDSKKDSDLLKIKLDAKTLEAAEMNQFDFTKGKNTGFIKSQFEIFKMERTHDPPIKQRDYIKSPAKLYAHFLNWIRNKFPKNGSEKHKNGNSESKGIGKSIEFDKA